MDSQIWRQHYGATESCLKTLVYSNEKHNEENLNFCTDASANNSYTFYFADITILKNTL